MTAALQLAAALPGPQRAAGLASDTLLRDDVAALPPVRDGRRRLPAGPGLGVAPDAARLSRLVSGGPRPGSWRARSAGPLEPALPGFCRERLAGYKVPVAFHCVAELPRDASGKLLRRRLVAGADRASSRPDAPAGTN